MKKKLLFALLVAVMVCLFSFTVNAAGEVTLTDGTNADFATVFKVSNNQVKGFNDGYTMDDVTDVVFPDEIEGIESNGLFSQAANLNTLTFAATDTFFISGDNIFTKCSVKTITFDPNCVVELRKGNFSGCTSLTQITFPKFKMLAGNAFQGCASMVSTNDLVFAEGMTEIGGHVFNGCVKLTGTVYFPSTLKTIKEFSFCNTGFTYFDLSKCKELSSVGGGYGGPFNNNDSITTLDLSNCTSLTSLHKSFAEGCDNLANVILPPNLETVPHKAFAHCYKLESIVLPASVETVADEAFHSARRNQDVKTFTVYLQSNVQFHETNSFRDSSAKIEFVLIGDGVTATSFKAANTYAAITGATIVDYLDSESPWTYTVGKAITNHTIVENYCAALALTDSHSYSANPCVNICTECGLLTVKDNPEHSISVSVTYENGYDSVGIKLTTCNNDGCGHKETAEAEALFARIGYSAPENGGDGIVIGHTVNIKAIEEYESITKKTVKYGVFAVSQDSLGDNDIFGESGAADGVIHVEIVNRQLIVFELKIVGFTDKQKDAKLAMGAYVAVTDGKTTEYSYMQDSEKGEACGDYYFASYNDFVGKTPTEETDAQ